MGYYMNLFESYRCQDDHFLETVYFRKSIKICNWSEEQYVTEIGKLGQMQHRVIVLFIWWSIVSHICSENFRSKSYDFFKLITFNWLKWLLFAVTTFVAYKCWLAAFWQWTPNGSNMTPVSLYQIYSKLADWEIPQDSLWFSGHK